MKFAILAVAAALAVSGPLHMPQGDDHGRDKTPDSSQGVRPYDKQNKPDKM